MGTMTVSNLGMFGTHSFTPIINQPEAAILGVNAALDRLVLENGVVAVHKFIILSLTYDHRIINGTEAAAFESRMKTLLEHPAQLLY
jgi:pyruvate dehydrogenase E2 component (dihydrolipoamide acetyltransferase)